MRRSLIRAATNRVAAAGCLIVLTVLAPIALASRASAQVAPHESWHTLVTPRFRVHFTAPHEELARRAAASAEEAYTRLAEELHPPRGTIDLVIADNVDYSNGFATPFPTNRIVVYAHPPATGQSLRFYHDWSSLLITHELTHIFHLDRTRGWWRGAQYVFGRSPLLFPNFYQPRWLTEGLAVYYETRLTGYGRLAASEHRMIARAGAMAGTTPRLDELSLATPSFPGGQLSYAYGSLLFEHLAATRGPATIPEFVERSSRYAIPFMIDRAARRSFGISFSRAWQEWTDSAGAVGGEGGVPLPGWRTLVTGEQYALHPRWESDSTILYSASNGREPPAVHRIGLDGAGERLARRNGVDANVPGGQGVVTAQLDYTSAYHVRSDLYIARGRELEERRLTTGARLTLPDVRRDGAVVGVRAGGGSMQLVRWDDGVVRAITSAHPDTIWTEPRWSPEGARIAAVRWIRGGTSEVVVLDTTGALRRVLARDRAVSSSPSWSPDGRLVLYSSDRSGVSELYLVRLEDSRDPVAAGDEERSTGDPVIPESVRLSDGSPGMFQPEISPDGRWIAAVRFMEGGHHVGIAPFDTTAGLPDERPARGSGPAVAPMAPAGSWDGPVRPYRAWRTALPRYWLPTVLSFGAQAEVGALTGGEDVIGRHSWQLSGWRRLDGEYYGVEGVYRWAGLGVPVLESSLRAARQGFLFDGTAYVESERAIDFGVSGTRPRVRSRSWAAAGIELSRFEYRRAGGGSADPIQPRIDRRGVYVSGGFGDASWPALAISPQDGLSLSGTARFRQIVVPDDTRGSFQLTGIAAGYRSLDLPGFSRHVLAARIAGGWTDQNAGSYFAVGGTSGGTLAIAPGLSLGAGRRNFGVRGFPAGTLAGIRAAAGSVEYRAPLVIPARGWRALPIFLDRVSLTLFADAGSAWCPGTGESRGACPDSGIAPITLASTGAELNLDAAVLAWDFPYRFRLGAAAPVARRDLAPRAATVYVSVGTSF